MRGGIGRITRRREIGMRGVKEGRAMAAGRGRRGEIRATRGIGMKRGKGE